MPSCQVEYLHDRTRASLEVTIRYAVPGLTHRRIKIGVNFLDPGKRGPVSHSTIVLSPQQQYDRSQRTQMAGSIQT